MKNNKNTSKKPIITSVLALLLIALFLVASSSFKEDKKDNLLDNAPSGDVLSIRFIDVGQGDSELIQLPDGKNILIDAGEKDGADDLIEKLNDYGVSTIDYLVATHPHSDHIGAMRVVVKEFDIGEIYMPRVSNDTKSYEKLLKAIKEKGLTINTAKAGKIIYQSDKILIEILSPLRDEYDELNNYSAVIKLTYDNSTFLFSGDAEKEVENDMMDEYYEKLDCDVLKVGHHGSKYSSSSEFISAVSPTYAVIECGEDNSYNHPHIDTVKRLESLDIKLYRTDLNGDVSIMTSGDGKYYIETEKQ